MKAFLTAALAALSLMAMTATGDPLPLSSLSPRDIALAAEAMKSPYAATLSGGANLVVVDGQAQRLVLWQGGEAKCAYPVSTALAGMGCAENSGRTPTGWHRVAEWIGAGAAPGQVFVSRVATDEVIPPAGWRATGGEDKVLTRILWLEGLETGRNRGPGVDSHARYIYIHGTNQEQLLGTPASHGCVRLSNRDAIDLFRRTFGTETLCLIAGGPRE